MVYHVLNGDSLTERFLSTGIQGEVVVARECLIEGNLTGESLSEFWLARADYLSKTYGEPSDTYLQQVVPEFDKLSKVESGDEVNLWFEHDLFCQANMWFTFSLLPKSDIDVNVIYPLVNNEEHPWWGFGTSQPIHLQQAFDQKIPFDETDKELCLNLWQAYKGGDLDRLKSLATAKSRCFPKLQEVCQAQIDRFPGNGSLGRPEAMLKSIIEELGSNDFGTVFKEFSKREGIYGFGDSQVKVLYDQIVN